MDARKADCDFYSSKLISMEGINIAFSAIESKPNYYTFNLGQNMASMLEI